MHKSDRMWSARVVSPEELTSEERQLWRNTCNTNHEFRSPFYSYGFSTAVSQARPHVRVSVLQRNAEIVGFFPFQFSSTFHRLLSSAERVGGDMSDHCGLIGVVDFRLSPPELLKLARLSAFEFQDLSGEQERFGLVGQRTLRGLRLDIRDGGTAYWRHLKRTNRRFTSEVERGERQLVAKYGPLLFTANVRKSEAEAELSRLIRIKGEQYQRTVGMNLFDASWRRTLLSRIMESRDEQCAAMLSTLYAGDTWLASHFGIRSKSVLHYWHPVYSTDVARFSPGHILTKYLISSAGDNGLSYFDLGGYGDYKRQFGPMVYPMSAGIWTSSGVAGLISRVHQSVVWRLAALQSKLKRRAD